MYMDKIKIDDIAFSLSNKTVKSILKLVEDNKFISEIKADKKLVRIISIIFRIRSRDKILTFPVDVIFLAFLETFFK